MKSMRRSFTSTFSSDNGQDIRDLCHQHGISIVGDLPIFVAHDSSDVWTNPHLFKMDEAGNPTVVAGVPPDFFSKTGQLWGNPIYDWERMQQEGFAWWVTHIKAMLEVFDIVRLDHFRGFAAAWEVPHGNATAEHGAWVNAPGRELFSALRYSLGELPIIVEDLGMITPDVEELRDEFGLAGMRILQFGFGGDAKNPHLPHNFINNAVVYTGTHDNDTARGWFASLKVRKVTEANAHLARARNDCLKISQFERTRDTLGLNSSIPCLGRGCRDRASTGRARSRLGRTHESSGNGSRQLELAISRRTIEGEGVETPARDVRDLWQDVTP